MLTVTPLIRNSSSVIKYNSDTKSNYPLEALESLSFCYSYIYCFCKTHMMSQRNIDGNKNPDHMVNVQIFCKIRRLYLENCKRS